MLLKVIIVFLSIHVSSDVLSQDSDSLKCWSERDKLIWIDFKGKIPEGQESMQLNAVTTCGLMPIAFRKNGLLSYKIKVLFKRYQSWTTDTSSQAMLSHEQLHFDIAELYARKLRKAIREASETIRDPMENDFDSIFEKLFTENAQTQRKYDDATIHGLDKESQGEWSKKICLEMEKLSDYASNPSDCK